MVCMDAVLDLIDLLDFGFVSRFVDLVDLLLFMEETVTIALIYCQ